LQRTSTLMEGATEYDLKVYVVEEVSELAGKNTGM
jgi:hypothetical protein